ncbi:hypothetical protein [Bosea sp. AAP35]|uniref:hypothetical protein n=1 Tax=Bosea sp. AAP35 TaxID=1523417 RepID=UPI000B22DB11|nr:hypothetical protein [Bosea sp. AAP35]
MKTSPFGKAFIAFLVAGAGFVSAERAQAFWQRSQVSMCADAVSERERARHRCDELNGFADPGWPALGLGGAGHRSGLHLSPGYRDIPANRPPVRRLG